MRGRFLMLPVVVATLASAGCENFLDTEPRTIPRDEFQQTFLHMSQATIRVYASMRDMVATNYRLLGDLQGDLTTLQVDTNDRNVDLIDLEQITETASNPVVEAEYKSIFKTIFDANSVLDRIDAIEIPADSVARREQLKAEAKTARALSYWLALQYWGLGQSWEPNNLAVPLVLHEIQDPDEAYLFERATVKEVFDQIVKDLQEAKPALPLKASLATADIGRMSRGTATFLLAATYQLDPSAASQQLALAQLTELGTMGNSLVTAGNAVSSGNAYRNVFNPSNKNNAESILEIQYNVTIDATFQFTPTRQNLNGDHTPLNALGGGSAADTTRIAVFGPGGTGRYLPTQSHVLSFAGADPSRAAAPFDLRYRGGYGAFCPGSGTSPRLGNVADQLRTVGDASVRKPNTGYPEVNIASVRDPLSAAVRANCIAYYTKWRWPQSANMPLPDRDNNNFIVFRYADALLRRAEVLVRLGRQAEALPFINQVRTRAGLPGLTTVTLDNILQERAWELAGEGHRWFDLKRFGKAVEVMNAHGADRIARIPGAPASGWMRDNSTFRLRLPVPPRDVVLTGCRVKQNPGWPGDCIGS